MGSSKRSKLTTNTGIHPRNGRRTKNPADHQSPTRKQSLKYLEIPAIEFRQGSNRKLYSFAVEGKEVLDFATVSRIHRDDNQSVAGYQRPQVISHISEIRKYLESDNPMIPNAIVIAFDNRVEFRADKKVNSSKNSFSRTGIMKIPIKNGYDGFKKPGWIVDGQQRVSAIKESRLKSFPIAAMGFIAGSDEEQREQFILVNSTKPLPKGLIYELLPSTSARLSTALERRKFPAVLSERLNLDEDSPFRGKIKTATNPNGIISDNTILEMLDNSLTDGVLFRFRISNTGKGDVEAMLKILKPFWSAVADVFGDAMNLPPKKSRLTHKAGICGMGFLMDAITERYRDFEFVTREQYRSDLEKLEPVCRFTHGYWDFGPETKRKWNEIQGVHRDMELMANYLLSNYKKLVWAREPISAH